MFAVSLLTEAHGKIKAMDIQTRRLLSMSEQGQQNGADFNLVSM